jgi:hypothetical protein
VLVWKINNRVMTKIRKIPFLHDRFMESITDSKIDLATVQPPFILMGASPLKKTENKTYYPIWPSSCDLDL